MKEDDNNPIQENKKFRFGLDDLIDNETINNDDEYSDLHDCSDDLSDRGSKKEEYEHAKFAESKRKNSYNYSYKSYTNNNYGKKQVVLLDKNKKFLVYFFVFIFIILPILQTVVGLVVALVGGISTGIIDEVSSDFSREIFTTTSNTVNDESLVSDLQTQRDDVIVSAKILKPGEVIVETQNTGSYAMTNIRVQVIFYDGENKPICISDVNINTLFANQKNMQKIYNVPESFERYDFLVTQPYQFDRPVVNYSEINVEVVSDNGSYVVFEIANDTEENLNDVQIAVLGYKGDELVSFDTRSVWEIKSGKTKETNLYIDSTQCDKIEYFVNDVYTDI